MHSDDIWIDLELQNKNWKQGWWMVHYDGIWNDLELLCQYLWVLTLIPLGLHFLLHFGVFHFLEKDVGPELQVLHVATPVWYGVKFTIKNNFSSHFEHSALVCR